MGCSLLILIKNLIIDHNKFHIGNIYNSLRELSFEFISSIPICFFGFPAESE